MFYHPVKVWRRDVLKHRTYHVGNHGDLKSKDSNNSTVMRITYDDYPCGILTVGRSSTSFLQIFTYEFDLISHIHDQ